MDIEKTNALQPIEENILATVDIEKLPQIFSEHIQLVESANHEYEEAEKKEKFAQDKVAKTLKEADNLIKSAKNVGGHTARTKSFLGIKYTSKDDEIEAIKLNLNEIIAHGEDSAVAQKKLAEVQSVVLESQTSVLKLQKTHFEYQQKIAEATKFVFGLSAYNMATNQSVLIKLKAILSGASEKELGELAQNQLFMALDQIKNQENIITRMKDNEDLIKQLNESIEAKQNEIAQIGENYAEQNKKISENADKIGDIEEDVDAIEAKNEEQDNLLKSHDENIDEIEENVDAIEKNIDEVEENIDEIEEDVEENRADIQKNLGKINDLIAEVAALKIAETEAEKKIAQTKIIALVSGGIGVVSLVLSALIALGII